MDHPVARFNIAACSSFLSAVYPDKGPECGEAINILLAEDEKSLFVTDITKGLLAVSLPAGHVENLLPIGSKVPGKTTD